MEVAFFTKNEDLISKTERIAGHVPGYRIRNSDPDGRYVLDKEIISNANLPCLLQHTVIQKGKENVSNLHLYVLCAPHLEVGGWGNNAYVLEVSGRQILAANRGGKWLALGATIPFKHLSCGYVGFSDGWQDVSRHLKMDWEFDQALNGNVALTGELDLQDNYEFTLATCFR